MTKYIFSFLLLFFSLNFGYSQNRIVKGLVIDEDLEPIGNLLISINDSIKVGTTDIEGRFQIEIPTSVNKISFACIGYTPVRDKKSQIKVGNLAIYLYLYS